MIDFFTNSGYNIRKFIGQFATILSVNKTRDFWDGHVMPIFCFGCG